MSTPDYIKSLTRQCEIINRLVLEAEESIDTAKSRHLFGMARDESDNISKSLRAYLARKRPGHKLNAA